MENCMNTLLKQTTVCLSVALSLALPGLAHSATIDHYPRDAGIGYTGFGEVTDQPTTYFFGQTFIAPGGNALDLTFDMYNRDSYPNEVNFTVLLAKMGDTPGGVTPTEILYESNLQSAAVNDGWTTFTVGLGDTPLTSGQAYAFIFDSFITRDGLNDRAGIGANEATGGYDDGYAFAININPQLFNNPDFQTANGASAQRDFIFANPGLENAFGGCLTCVNEMNRQNDVAFRLTTDSSVSAVPLPASVWLLSSGLAGLVGIARRRYATDIMA